MELSGVIVGLVIVIGVAYLIPLALAARDQELPDDEELRIPSTGIVVHQPIDETEDIDVSTPLTRRALAFQAWRISRRSAGRRSTIALLFLVSLLALVGTSIAGLTSWTAAVWVGGGLVVWLVISRLAAQLQARMLDKHLTRAAMVDDEDTICFTLAQTSDDGDVEISAPIPFVGSLWDPVPVTAPTYVQQPLAPRTVRTIDLSAPAPGQPPVVAPELPPELPRAVGE